jgi:hypothetical protein
MKHDGMKMTSPVGSFALVRPKQEKVRAVKKITTLSSWSPQHDLQFPETEDSFL